VVVGSHGWRLQSEVETALARILGLKVKAFNLYEV
jgi:hypothetical protein